MGGFTTWLGVLPLAFSSTAVFWMVFIGFIAMVTLGCSVGLMLLPVLLSIAGPMSDIQSHSQTAVVKKPAVIESYTEIPSPPEPTQEISTRKPPGNENEVEC